MDAAINAKKRVNTLWEAWNSANGKGRKMYKELVQILSLAPSICQLKIRTQGASHDQIKYDMHAI